MGPIRYDVTFMEYASHLQIQILPLFLLTLLKMMTYLKGK